jgi:hypothetical protein
MKQDSLLQRRHRHLFEAATYHLQLVNTQSLDNKAGMHYVSYFY